MHGVGPVNMLSTADAAALLGVSPRYITKLAQTGRLPAKKHGRRTWVFERAAVEAYVRPPVGNPNLKKKE